MRNQLQPRASLLCISEELSVAATLEAPFLNSPYVHDLNHLISHPRELGKPLVIFLSDQPGKDKRRDLLEPQALLESLHPRLMSPGRWPSDPTHGLYAAQQTALNIALAALRDSPGLVGINGPPGTGKTTLLREVVADTVVARARRLLEADPLELFGPSRYPIFEKSGYYRPNRDVFAGDGIVVSGNNNTAIENISKELPAAGSIHRETFGEAEYFSATATHVFGKPCWGMLSAVLGKSDNRNTFISRWWFSKGLAFRAFLKDQYENADQNRQNLQNYQDTAGELKTLLAEYEQFRQMAAAYHQLAAAYHDGRPADPAASVQLAASPQLAASLQLPASPQLASSLQSEYGIHARNLPDSRWLGLPLETIHGLTPYSSEKINVLRSQIFLRSLELQEWAIRVNARYFNSNLNTFVDVLSGKLAGHIDEDAAAALWNTFFFCIPVVSVTLASFQRQFVKMGQGSIGWLLLDEAGQVTLPSVCGAIWRSRRCIVIGDTRQIPPVVTIPQELEGLLQKAYGVSGSDWSPLRQSAQSLADRVTTTGTYIRVEAAKSPVWTGIPLRLHRRCSEPMFSIANAIAYGGQMVRSAVDRPADDVTGRPADDVVGRLADDLAGLPTGPSGWIDVQMSTPLDGHAIAEELSVLGDMLQQLTYYPAPIFVISPFRSVAEMCKERFYKKDRVECGTIHTFQGKEADIVFLVLGTHPRHSMAREWVADTPNMLNVAVTRAKRRLYVIGSCTAWSGLPYFAELAQRLPVRQSGMLF
jgi:hypothetical protein